MALFDDIYRASAQEVLMATLGDKDAVLYLAADGTQSGPFDALLRNERWETEITASGERRVRAMDCTVRTSDQKTIDKRGTFVVVATNERWGIRIVSSKSPTLLWCELYNRTAFEDTRPEARSAPA